MSLCLIYFNNFSDSTSSVEPDVKPAAVMNHSTLEGVIHFL